MLKRYQVLLNDWLTDYLKYYARKYDISFSEIMRLMLCMEAAVSIMTKYPRHKANVTLKDVHKYTWTLSQRGDIIEENGHKLASQIYFEARKAIECFLAQQKKKPKKTNKSQSAGKLNKET